MIAALVNDATIATANNEAAALAVPDTRERLLAKLAFELPGIAGIAGCWTFTGAPRNNGYGRLTVALGDGRRRNIRVHRLAYVAAYGPIPPGLVIDHLCGNKLCANPAHLEAVTNAENSRRINGDKTHCGRGHLYIPENTYIDRRDGARLCKTCQAFFAERRRRRLGIRSRLRGRPGPGQGSLL